MRGQPAGDRPYLFARWTYSGAAFCMAPACRAVAVSVAMVKALREDPVLLTLCGPCSDVVDGACLTEGRKDRPSG